MSFHTLKTSGSSLKNLQYGIDMVSHNIANINTTGYKKQVPNFSAVVNSKSTAADGLSGTALNATTTVFTQGNLRNTGQWTDLAIQGEGFFTVQTVEGDIAYTRAGHFMPDSNGDLVDANGNYLLSVGGGRITLPVEAERVEIGQLGEINVRYEGVRDFEYYDQVQLATFINTSGLQKLGNNNYQETTNSGAPVFSTAGQDGSQTNDSFIVSGALEYANTNMSESLTNLMSFQRAYQAVSRTTTASDEILQTTINLAS